MFEKEEVLILKSQNAFVKERQILDFVLITNEYLDARIESGVSSILCKLDMEKAFVHVNCDFLLYILGRYGFGERWWRWMKHCISIVRFLVLVNGTLAGFFNRFNKLRQS